ncbi:MAG: fumarate reductase subunit D [Planctomycetes bacterium]|nr:fumarate reductase subunit D [Planctomycetota bacterium]
MARATGETIWWSLFAAGGVVAALLVPALIFITGVAIPFVNQGQVPSLKPMYHTEVMKRAGSVPGRVLLFVVISFSLFHCVHRFRHTLKDLGLHGAQGLVALLCYGSATLGSVLAGWLVCML